MIDNMRTHVTVYDSVMGSGKTSLAVQYMNENPNKKFIYITPFLDEVKRIIASCPELGFIEPNTSKDYPTKSKHFERLVELGKNISSTHALFEKIDDRTMLAIRNEGYHLILDEAISVLNAYERDNSNTRRHLSEDSLDRKLQNDVNALIEYGALSVNDEKVVSWVGQGLSEYDRMRDLADRGILYYVSDSVLLWSFPYDIFLKGIFESVSILTYQFDKQVMSKYLDFFNIEYDMYYVTSDSVGKYYELPYEKDGAHEEEFIRGLRNRIRILEDDALNHIGRADGNRYNKLSKGWWDRNLKDAAPEMNRNITNFFRYKTNVPASYRAWTCFKPHMNKISGKYVSSRHWVAFNQRATNEFRQKKVVAYCVNRYHRPIMRQFFERKNILLDEDDHALSEMLQFIFRFSIRAGGDIDLYMPSARMRGILESYLAMDEPQNYRSYV